MLEFQRHGLHILSLFVQLSSSNRPATFPSSNQDTVALQLFAVVFRVPTLRDPPSGLEPLADC